MLGVPTVIDRVIQQAMAQVLTPIFDRGGLCLCLMVFVRVSLLMTR